MQQQTSNTPTGATPELKRHQVYITIESDMASCGVLSPAVRWMRYDMSDEGSVFEQDPVVGWERCHFELCGSDAIFRVRVDQHGAATEAEIIVNGATVAQLSTKGPPSSKLFECVV